MTQQEQIDQFHTERLGGIGGSDVAVILGLSKWKTPYQLWLEKTRRARMQCAGCTVRRTQKREQILNQDDVDYMLHGDKDPHDKDQHQPGAKLDAGKPRPWLVLGGFRCAIKEVVAVGTMGAEKYSDNGWLEVPNAQQRYLDAAFRHLLALDVRDAESDLPHLAHAAWNILAVLELRARGLG